ncbi:MAG: nicotinate-nucleotide--dimethylbenzimidazole phosphoribosyltransferase [Dehalococcoidia bacterium]
MRELVERTCAAIGPLDHAAMEAARARQPHLTKPWGSLGRLEDLATQIAGITGNAIPQLGARTIITCAGDHGVVSEGISMFGPDTTPAMVLNFLAGGAGINVLARLAGADVLVLDVGVAAELPKHPKLLRRKVARGTANLAEGPAMTRDQAWAAIAAGIDAANAAIDGGATLLGTGDMGIANTTPSSAMVAAFSGEPVPRVTGRGTGIDDATLAHKIAVIERALAVNQPDPSDPIDVVAKVGGLEIAAIAGVCLAGAARRAPVVIDGFISSAGALLAYRLAPAVQPYLIAGHASVEIGQRVVLRELGLQPLINLDLRLGEGTGAALAMPLVEAACRILSEMNTWDGASVAGPLVADEDARTA